MKVLELYLFLGARVADRADSTPDRSVVILVFVFAYTRSPTGAPSEKGVILVLKISLF